MNGRIDVDAALAQLNRTRGNSGREIASPLEIDGVRLLAEEIADNTRCIRNLMVARDELFTWLQNYYLLDDFVARQPCVSKITLNRPIFIVSPGRTGSTLLHNMMSQDRRMRAPLLWELWNPTDDKAQDPDIDDPRIEQTRQRLEAMRFYLPKLFEIHPMRADLPEECHWIIRHATTSAMQYHAPRYWTWLRNRPPTDLRRIYETYRLHVQCLLMGDGSQFWLSKSVAHLHYLPVLAEVFPGARIIRMHRNPLAVIPSLCNLFWCLNSMYDNRQTAADFGRLVLDIYEDGMNRLVAADRNDGDAIFADVVFDDLIGDPYLAIERLYAELNVSYEESARAAIERYLGEHVASSRSKVPYSLTDFGLTEKAVVEQLRPYLDWSNARLGIDLVRAR